MAQKVVTLDNLLKLVESKVGKKQNYVLDNYNDVSNIIIYDADLINVPSTLKNTCDGVHCVLNSSIIQDLNVELPNQPFLWLEDVKDRTKFQIDGISIENDNLIDFIYILDWRAKNENI